MTTGLRIVILLLILSLTAGAITGAAIYYRLSYLWGMLIAVSGIWSWLSLRGLTYRRSARTTRAQVGQVFEERIEINNPSRLPRFLLSVRDESALPNAQGSRVFPYIEPFRGRTYLARTRLSERGVFSLGPTVVESGDPFGLFPVERVLPADEALLVYPMMVELHSFPSPAGIMPGGDSLRRRTPQITPNAAGVRQYAPGDALNRIHWPTTARRGELMAKEFELDPQAEVWIFLDAARFTQVSLAEESSRELDDDLWRRKANRTLPPRTEEYGVSVAASVARYFIRNNRSVGFIASGQSLTLLPSDKGGRQLGKILEALALLRAEGQLPLRGLIEIHAQNLTRGSTVIVITASPEEEVALSMDYLLRRGLRAVAVLIDPASFNGPAGTGELAGMLKLLKIPVRVIRRGDDLEAGLSEERVQKLSF